MLVRLAHIADADRAVDVVRRSIQELCVCDHKGDAATLSTWLSNKTVENMRRWIANDTVYLALDEKIAGVASVRSDGFVLLNYVAPEARFKGASKSLLQRIELWASRRGLKWLALDSTATALRLYLSHGWTITGPPQPGFGIAMRHPMRKAVTIVPPD
jgi:GNAT superfamily N-acetyltransferase